MSLNIEAIVEYSKRHLFLKRILLAGVPFSECNSVFKESSRASGILSTIKLEAEIMFKCLSEEDTRNFNVDLDTIYSIFDAVVSHDVITLIQMVPLIKEQLPVLSKLRFVKLESQVEAELELMKTAREISSRIKPNPSSRKKLSKKKKKKRRYNRQFKKNCENQRCEAEKIILSGSKNDIIPKASYLIRPLMPRPPP